MPAIAQTTSCRSCNRHYPSDEGSIFEGFCAQCIDQQYVICAECGRLTHRGRTPVGRRLLPGHLGGDAYMVEGEVVCYLCYDTHDSSGQYWQPKPLDVSFATYDRIGSKRKFGVEIETSHCRRREELQEHTNFGCKDDPSVPGREFDSPIMYGDEGLDHIVDFLAMANERDWQVDRSCGCHIHLDLRNESRDQLFHIAYAYAFTNKIWRRCVPRNMQDRPYCRPPRYRASDIEAGYDTGTEYERYSYSVDRYYHVNLSAYGEHGTIEVRLLEGTLDAEVICNWITVHCRFIDAVKDLSFRDMRRLFNHPARRNFRSLVDLIGDTDLTNWVAMRARQVGLRPLRGPRLQSS